MALPDAAYVPVACMLTNLKIRVEPSQKLPKLRSLPSFANVFESVKLIWRCTKELEAILGKSCNADLHVIWSTVWQISPKWLVAKHPRILW